MCFCHWPTCSFKGFCAEDRGAFHHSADKREQLLASATVAAASLMAVVPAADAAVSPSLKNLLLSVAAGATVVGAIVVAISGVAQFDQIARK